MSDDDSARLGLPYLAAGQLQKHVTLNEALTRLDALVQTAVVSRTLTTQPPDPADGVLYIVPEGATGSAWAEAPTGALMRYEAGGWVVQPTPPGLLAVVLDSGEVVRRDGEGWSALGQGLARLGVNATADDANPVVLRTPKVLMTAPVGDEGDDLRLTLNKAASADVLSLLMQSGWGGRAEIGLIGDDDLTIKVSADGGAWREALRIDRATGRVGFSRGAARVATRLFESDGVLTLPAWARAACAVAVGGGGGGGSGACGASGARSGGSGGGSGGLIQGLWPVEALEGDLIITVGTSGAGGAATSSPAGEQGGQGGDSVIMDATGQLLRAFGGAGGRGGDGSGGSGGLPGHGGNAGGGALPAQAGQAGGALAPTGPGGGAGGGALSGASGLAGGVGGTGAAGVVPSTGGAASAAGQAASRTELSLAGGGGGGGNGGATGESGGSGGDFGGGGGGGGAGSTLSGAGGAGAPGAVLITLIG